MKDTKDNSAFWFQVLGFVLGIALMRMLGIN